MVARTLSMSLLAAGLLGASLRAQPQIQVPGAGAGNYRILVNEVDSSEFPRIKLRFKVLIQNAGAPEWDPSIPLQVVEDVQLTKDGQPQLDRKEGRIVEAPSLCDIQPVAMGVAIDVSGSVAPVADAISQGTQAVFQKMYEESQKFQVRDVGALYAFSTDTQQRFPLPQGSPGQQGVPGQQGGFVPGSAIQGSTIAGWNGATAPAGAPGAGASYYTEGQGLMQLAQIAQQLPRGGGSPIWNGMKNEANLLSLHDPQNSRLQRVLVTLTDGQDNESGGQDVQQLLQFAQQSGLTLVNLGYGQTNDMGLATLAQMSGGVYVSGVNQNIDQVLIAILGGMRKTYCLTYESPHPNLVNEPALVNVVTQGSSGQGVFPLPFVIPEDSSQVKLFVPMTEYTYKALSQGKDFSSSPLFAATTASLVGADGAAWKPGKTDKGMIGPDRAFTEFQFYATEWTEGTKDQPLSGWGFYLTSDKEEWTRMYKVPTDWVNLKADEKTQVVTGVSHWELAANLEEPTAPQNTGGSRAARSYPVRVRLSVQDRTPPHLLVRARPMDGGAQMELRVLPQAVDEDPQIMQAYGDRPTYAMAQSPGQGNKLARAVYSWRDAEGRAVEGDLPAQLWGLWDDQQEPVFTGTDPVTGAVTTAMKGDAHGVFTTGITMKAGSRMLFEVAARDNFALLEQSSLDADKLAFDVPATAVPLADGQSREEPVHAQFDLSLPEAEPFAEKAPFLPFMKLEDQKKDENRGKPGVTWWIESKDERDRNAGIEGITEVQYQLHDEVIRPGLGQVVVGPDEPLRILKVRAQDGQGNFTVVDLPIRVLPNGFNARTLDWKTRRVADGQVD